MNNCIRRTFPPFDSIHHVIITGEFRHFMKIKMRWNSDIKRFCVKETGSPSGTGGCESSLETLRLKSTVGAK